jgi:predicted metal-dependent HD superfamily phosphohydrolase
MTPSPERIDRLQQQWWHLLRPFGAEPSAVYTAFDELGVRYSEPHRHYHTLEHIAEMLRLLPRLTPAGTDPFPIALAVWFHDAVYDPKAGDNELRSADLASVVLTRLTVPGETVAFAAELIRSTDHRVSIADDALVEFAVLHDADLVILGASPARYDRYAADIRREYARVSEDDYRIGRSKVLRAFLERPRLFLTPLLFEEGEAPARENLARELEMLREDMQRLW